MAKKTPADYFKIAMQVLAILCLVAYVVLLFHKGTVDLTALAKQHPEENFWIVLGRHFIRSLGGG